MQQPQSVKKLVPKKKEIVTEDEEGIELSDEDFEEVGVVKKRSMAHPVRQEPEEPEEEEDEEDEEPKKKKKSRLAQGFSSVPLSGSDRVKAGNYEAVIRMTLQPYVEGKGQAVRINARLAPPEFREYEPLVDWRTLLTKAGEVNPMGFRIIGREMNILGYKVPDVESGDFDAELDEIFGQIVQDEPGAIIKVFYQTYEGVDYQHFSILDRCDSDVIDELKDNIAF